MGNLDPLFRWTPAEDKIVRRLYPQGGIDACFPRLRKYKRTPAAIYARARALGLVGAGDTVLRRAVRDALATARFAGSPLGEIMSAPEDCHEDSGCTVNLRAMLRLKSAMDKLPSPASEAHDPRGTHER